jgi:hypothetical protein
LEKKCARLKKKIVLKLSAGKQILYKNSNLGVLGRVYCWTVLEEEDSTLKTRDYGL